ncbi:MAG TPA: S41 family peptidase [Candidatus Acidoferrales bacterium]|nr:S41 family peptidase [Candidatus Acidoferrales bacterium]
MGRTIRIGVLSLSVAVLLYVSLGYVFGQTGDDQSYRSLAVYSEVLDRIQQDYVDAPDTHVVTVGALHGLLEALDPESSYLTPQEYADLKKETESKAPAGVGAAFSKRGFIFVVSVLPDSPALKSGLHEGDVLESIGGYTTQDMSVQQAQGFLRGEPGTTVKVSVIRSGSPKPQDVELTRAVVPEPALLTTREEAGIAYLRVPEFDRGSAAAIRSQLAQFQRRGDRKLILDLRGCASGETSEAIQTAQWFLNSGTITTLRGQTIAEKSFAADPSKVAWRDPVTVLISGSTAGPAEILAAAIADNGRGDTVGQTTLGLSSEQKLIPLEDGSALFVTAGIYYTPANKPILNAGVAPQVQVPPPNSQLSLLDDQDVAPDPLPGQLPAPTDPVVKKAIEVLETKPAASATARRSSPLESPAQQSPQWMPTTGG